MLALPGKSTFNVRGFKGVPKPSFQRTLESIGFCHRKSKWIPAFSGMTAYRNPGFLVATDGTLYLRTCFNLRPTHLCRLAHFAMHCGSNANDPPGNPSMNKSSLDKRAPDTHAPEPASTQIRPTEARLTEMVFPDHTNHLGTLFGGQALAWMDKAAFIAASRHARCTVVTARLERIDFHTAVLQGAMVELVARVVGTGRTSLQVEVEMHSEALHSGMRQLATRGRFTMVALDTNGQPCVVASLVE